MFVFFHLFDNSRVSRINPSILCADPDSLVRGGGGGGGESNFDFSFKLTRVEMRGSKYHNKQAIIGPPAIRQIWLFAGVPMMAHIWRFAGVPMMVQH